MGKSGRHGLEPRPCRIFRCSLFEPPLFAPLGRVLARAGQQKVSILDGPKSSWTPTDKCSFPAKSAWIKRMNECRNIWRPDLSSERNFGFVNVLIMYFLSIQKGHSSGSFGYETYARRGLHVDVFARPPLLQDLRLLILCNPKLTVCSRITHNTFRVQNQGSRAWCLRSD